MPWIGQRARNRRKASAAGSIADPVARLRFLRVPSPPWYARMSATSHRRWIPLAGIFLAVLIPFWIKLASGKPKPTPIVSLPHPMQSPDDREPMAVWQVQQTGDSEVYSNGLRIDTSLTVPNHPRLYMAFERSPSLGTTRVHRTQPVGIVYHTSQSCQAPFEAQETPLLKNLGQSLLEFVRKRRAYHYVVDRFGRVYRIVPECDAANHAGYSVWADDQYFYINLNDSFLGVSFEAQSQPGQTEGVISSGQIRAAAMLTEMLRSRYRIPAANCITHAQVSVNPSNMLIGYHTDWIAGFPFAALGLPDNYREPLPSLWAFGFSCESTWLESAARSLSQAARLEEGDIVRRAISAHMTPAAYRRSLHEQYRLWLAAARRSTLPDQPRSGSGSGSAGR